MNSKKKNQKRNGLSEKKKEAAKQDVLTKENVFKMLLVFDKIFDKMYDADKRKLLESMIWFSCSHFRLGIAHG